MKAREQAEIDAEVRRVAAVRRLQAAGAGDKERLDRISRMAARLMGTPVALISLLDDRSQLIQSSVGLDITEAPRADAFCDRTITTMGPTLVVEDALLDPRFADNPHVTGAPFLRFYAGQVVHDANGNAVGTICVNDQVPHTFDDDDQATLDDLAILVEQEFVRSEHRATLLEVDASERTKTLILESLNEGLVLQDAEGRIVEWNTAAERVLGMSGDQMAGRTSLDPTWRAVRIDGTPWPDDERPAIIALRTGVTVEDEVMGVFRPDGEVAWVRVNAHPTRTSDGAVSGVVVAFDDITLQHDLQVALERSELTARSSLDALEQGVMLIAEDGMVRRINPAAETILGYSAEQIVEMFRAGTWTTYDESGRPLTPDERPSARARRSGEPLLGVRVGWRRPDGRMILLRMSCVPDADGSDGMVVAFIDVTAETRMLAELTRFSYLFQNANDIITIVDETGLAFYSSPSTERLLGYPDGWHHTAGILAMVHPDDLAIAANELLALIENERGPEPFLVRVQAYDGGWRHVECIGVNLLDEPAVQGIVITARDATERVQLTAELHYRATHDELTGLSNRTILEDGLGQALNRARSGDHRVALCFIDLDGFKSVNDTLGHGAGDRLLVDVAARIRGAIREGDLAARVGGDEFVVVLDPVSSESDALVVARRIRDAVLTAGIGSAGNVAFGASVGLALNEPDDTPTAFLRRSDTALYRAKETHDSSIALAESGFDFDFSS